MGIGVFALHLAPCLKGCSFQREGVCVFTGSDAAQNIIAVSWPISLPQPAAPLWLRDAH